MRHCSTQPCHFTCSHAYACSQQTKHSLPLASYQDTPICVVSVFNGGLGKGCFVVFLFPHSFENMTLCICLVHLFFHFLNVQIGSKIDKMLYILHMMNGTKTFTESCWYLQGKHNTCNRGEYFCKWH